MDSGLSFDASSEVYGEEDLALAAGGGRARRTREVHLYLVLFVPGSFWLSETLIVSCFHLDDMCSFITFRLWFLHSRYIVRWQMK